MKPHHLLTLFLAALLPAHAAENAPARNPNILLIVADDLGYGDVSVQGCKDFATPHLDSIAKAGEPFHTTSEPDLPPAVEIPERIPQSVTQSPRQASCRGSTGLRMPRLQPDRPIAEMIP